MIDTDLPPSDPRQTMIGAARLFYQMGWMVGTAGNLSTRLPDGSFWITVSGRAKGELTSKDFIRVAPDGTVVERHQVNDKPSAETSIHQAIYELFPEARACYHVHSIEASLVSRFTNKDSLPIPAIEMLKGFGIWEESPQVEMPIFENYLQVPRIATEIGDRFSAKPPKMPALLIRDHGVTIWAPSPEAARNYIELVEYIFRYIVAARRVKEFDFAAAI